MELAKEILGKYGFDYVAEYIVGWREGHHIIDLLFDKTNAEEAERANQCFDELLTEFSARGWDRIVQTLPSWTKLLIPLVRLNVMLIKKLSAPWIPKASSHQESPGFIFKALICLLRTFYLDMASSYLLFTN